jgi:hypothetical protein
MDEVFGSYAGSYPQGRVDCSEPHRSIATVGSQAPEGFEGGCRPSDDLGGEMARSGRFRRNERAQITTQSCRRRPTLDHRAVSPAEVGADYGAVWPAEARADYGAIWPAEAGADDRAISPAQAGADPQRDEVRSAWQRRRQRPPS